MTGPVKDAIVVLGCRVGRDGLPSGALQRRCERAAQAFHDGLAGLVLVCGGKAWHGHQEAKAMAEVLARLGVPPERVVCELESQTTWGNAVHGAKVLRRLGARRLVVVTCDFHQTRALSAFERLGFEAVGLSCPTPAGGGTVRTRLKEAFFSFIQPGVAWRF
jgi:uncharacterized SAM-binding protein YcdF (DUF218 family)